MEYKFSIIVDSSTIETHGLCDGIPLRVHQNQALEDAGAIKAQQDWIRLMPTSSYHKGSLGPDYNFLSVAFPETKPERLEVLAYMNEFIFLHDDVVESTGKVEGDFLNDCAMNACRLGAAKPDQSRRSRSESMMTKISDRMMKIDAESGTQALKLWTEWFEHGAGRNNHHRYSNLEEYLAYRIKDVGEKYLTGVEIFALGLKLEESELDALPSLCRPAWIALGLTNDLYSYGKEVAAARDLDRTHVCNAIWVIMQEHVIGELDAKELCRHEVRRNVEEFIQTISTTIACPAVSTNLRAFLEAVQYILSGNIVWTLGAPRYNADASYNARQLEWLVHGLPPEFSCMSTPTS